MKILFATSEAVPYWKTGGLADVARALPDTLARRGHDVWLLHPLYRAVRASGLPLEPAGEVILPWPGGGVPVRYWLHRPEGGAPALLVESDPFFDVDEPYGPLPEDPNAAGRRFALFCRAAVERARSLGADVVHANDWATGLIPLYGLLEGLATPTVLAIHNLAYQGNFPPTLLPEIGVPWDFYRTENGVEFYGAASFLKGGIALADRLVTVSPSYAAEIQTPEYGAGMDGLLRFRARALHGILNGLDPATWNPATDPAIPAPYGPDRLAAKDKNRTELLHELGLDGRGPLLVAITRLAHQKGVDLIIEAIPALLRLRARLAVLGAGDPGYQDALAGAVAAHPRRVAAFFRFDDRLARRLYAGGDFFLMPSRYEPCGLGQMIAQRYGTVPIVRGTGGLRDTVEDGVTGFVFPNATADSLLDGVRRARAAWRGAGWDDMRRRCMALDWSWDASAARYEAVYAAAGGAPPP